MTLPAKRQLQCHPLAPQSALLRASLRPRPYWHLETKQNRITLNWQTQTQEMEVPLSENIRFLREHISSKTDNNAKRWLPS
jgi:hypothetical protein